jgi:glycosyltransferase involved in cell wall biosynthesis
MISVIVIGKNEGERLVKCLQSVQDTIMAYPALRFEVIYVDSASTDGSIETVMSRFPSVKAFKITGICNTAIARNIGARESSGDVLMFVDGDMKIRSEFLGHAIDEDGRLRYSPASGLREDHFYSPDGRFEQISVFPKTHKDTIFHRICGGFFMIQKEQFEQCGRFDDRFACKQDSDLGMRLSSMGHPLLIRNSIASEHHSVPYSERDLKFQVRDALYWGLYLRKHIFELPKVERKGLKPFFPIGIAILAMIFPSWWWIAVYVGTVVAAHLIKHRFTFKRVADWIIKDFVSIAGMLFFYPRKPEEKYVPCRKS